MKEVLIPYFIWNNYFGWYISRVSLKFAPQIKIKEKQEEKMNRFKGLFGLFKEVKNTQHHPELTEFLTHNKTFQNAVHKIEDFKGFLIKSLDEAAFPEEQKKLADKSQNKNSKTKKWGTMQEPSLRFSADST